MSVWERVGVEVAISAVLKPLTVLLVFVVIVEVINAIA